MKKLAAIFALLTMGAMAQDIEHAPTADQCHADISVWYGESKTDIAALSAHTLDVRRHEAWQCSAVLKDPQEREKAFGEANVYISHLQERMLNFIKRHGFMQQFADEDEKGVR
ncbi:MAG: hypothetical protein WAM78_19285 [Candidatus Sulfotelmatobacter sp.]